MSHLSEHFTLIEMTQSQTAVRKGLDNTPPPAAFRALKILCEDVLEPLRALVGDMPIRISSGFRSYELNDAIGGSRRSQHCKGEAVDIEIPGIDNRELALLIAESDRPFPIPFDQLILEYYDPDKGPGSGWVHISYKAAGNRGEALRAVRGVGYLRGLG